jgi:hypothetical protein
MIAGALQLALIAAALAGGEALPDASPGDAGSTPSPWAFAPGEHLVYSVSALGILGGTGELDVGTATVTGGIPTWPIVARARTEGVMEKLYPVHDRFVSWWDFVRGESVQTDLLTNEGKKRQMLAWQFTRTTKPGTTERQSSVLIQKTDSNGAISWNVAIEPDAVDVIAATYWLRSRPMRVGDVETHPVFSGNAQWTMKAEVVSKEAVETPAGKFAAVLVHMSTYFAGKLAAHRSVDFYFSDDRRHLPLKAEAELKLGTLRAELVHFEPQL